MACIILTSVLHLLEMLITWVPWSAKPRGSGQRPPAASAEIIDIARSA
jgi:hypothetical protein